MALSPTSSHGGGGGGGAVLAASVHVSTADMLTLYVTPVELVAAPGSGFVLSPVQVTFSYHFGTSAYFMGNFGVDWLADWTAAGSSDSALNLMASGITVDSKPNSAVFPVGVFQSSFQVLPALADGSALVLYGTIMNPDTGDGTVDVTTLYQTVPLTA